MSKKEKNCLNCRIHWDRESGCEVCRWEDGDHPSMFYQITRSPEVLAPKFVYEYTLNPPAASGAAKLFRSLLTGKNYYTESKAIAATVEKLKEVANDTK